MKEALLTICEKTFVSECILNNKRLDGRSAEDYRPIKINFGSEWGSVHVALGETRVMAQVTCEVIQPKSERPNEGCIYLNLELTPMAASHFDASRNSQQSVQINRILERAFNDSRCVDLESLCILAEEKVWNIRIDLNVLNHEGNIIDCASIATLTALAHFKRPDITISGDEVTIHTLSEKDPIPIALHHFPVCISYAIYNNGEIAIADPSAIEERVSEASMVFGLNSYRELCGLHLGGTTLTSSQLLLKCANRGAHRANAIVKLIKQSLEEDTKIRAEGKSVGFQECIRLEKITSMAQDRLPIKMKKFNLNDLNNESEELSNLKKEQHKVLLNKGIGVLLPIEETNDPDVEMQSEWIAELDDSYVDDDFNDTYEQDVLKSQQPSSRVSPTPKQSSKKKRINKRKRKGNKKDKNIENSHTIENTDDAGDHDNNDSEEETTVTLEATDNLY